MLMMVTRVVTNYICPKDYGVCGEFSIVLDDELCIHKVKVISGAKGLFIAFPNSGTVKENGTSRRYDDIVHPTNNFLRQAISDEVLKTYYEEVDALKE